MKKILSVILVLAAMISCQRTDLEENSASYPQFSAEMESFGTVTKTYVDYNYNVKWLDGDEVGIFQGSTIASKYIVRPSLNGSNASLYRSNDWMDEYNPTFSAGTELPTNVAFYPYGQGLEIETNTPTGSAIASGSRYSLYAYLPQVQDYVPGSFANGAFPMVAVTENQNDYTLHFKNAGAVLSFTLTGTQMIKAIIVKGNNGEILWGPTRIDMGYDELPVAVGLDPAAQDVVLNCSDCPVQLSQDSPTEFKVVIPPTNFSKGFTLVCVDVYDQLMYCSADGYREVLRNDIIEMDPLPYNPNSTVYDYYGGTIPGGINDPGQGGDSNDSGQGGGSNDPVMPASGPYAFLCVTPVTSLYNNVHGFYSSDLVSDPATSCLLRKYDSSLFPISFENSLQYIYDEQDLIQNGLSYNGTRYYPSYDCNSPVPWDQFFADCISNGEMNNFILISGNGTYLKIDDEGYHEVPLSSYSEDCYWIAATQNYIYNCLYQFGIIGTNAGLMMTTQSKEYYSVDLSSEVWKDITVDPFSLQMDYNVQDIIVNGLKYQNVALTPCVFFDDYSNANGQYELSELTWEELMSYSYGGASFNFMLKGDNGMYLVYNIATGAAEWKTSIDLSTDSWFTFFGPIGLYFSGNIQVTAGEYAVIVMAIDDRGFDEKEYFFSYDLDRDEYNYLGKLDSTTGPNSHTYDNMMRFFDSIWRSNDCVKYTYSQLENANTTNVYWLDARSSDPGTIMSWSDVMNETRISGNNLILPSLILDNGGGLFYFVDSPDSPPTPSTKYLGADVNFDPPKIQMYDVNTLPLKPEAQGIAVKYNCVSFVASHRGLQAISLLAILN